MSVENFDQLDTPERCLFCGEPLAGLMTLLCGAQGQIVALHQDCQKPFGERLQQLGLQAKQRH